MTSSRLLDMMGQWSCRRGDMCSGERIEEMEVVEVVEVSIIITSNLEPNNPSASAAAPPELA